MTPRSTLARMSSFRLTASQVVLLVMLMLLPHLAAQERHYVVTSDLVRLGLPSNPLSIAIDPQDPHGVWWWEPGTGGCRTRSTSAVLDAAQAIVSRAGANGQILVSFRTGLHSSHNPL